ncbi:MAG TPA: hypothetical protein V6D13_17360 [Halomicronema sp.]
MVSRITVEDKGVKLLGVGEGYFIVRDGTVTKVIPGLVTFSSCVMVADNIMIEISQNKLQLQAN